MQFRYEITDKSGKPMRGVMDAPSESDVYQRLVARGYSVNRVLPVGGPAPQSTPQARPVMPGPQSVVGHKYGTSVSASEMSVFFRGLSSYLKSGVPIYQALVQIGAQTPVRGMRFVCERMATLVQMGQSLSTAMTEFPRVFPPHVIGVTMAGELGGFLPAVVGDIALDYELEQRASNRWSKTISNVLWINAIGTLLVAPFLPLMYSTAATMDSNSPLDYLQAGLNAWLHYVTTYMAPPLALVLGAYFIAKFVLRQPNMRSVRDALRLRAPAGIGRANRLRSLASFTRILWRLQQAGILPIQAWDAASRAAENTHIAARLYQQVDAVRSGRKLSEALGATGLFTSEDQRVMALGESSGETADILHRMAAYYEDAALTAAGRGKWFMTRIAIWANILALAYVFYCTEIKTSMNIMDFVDKFMNVE